MAYLKKRSYKPPYLFAWPWTRRQNFVRTMTRTIEVGGGHASGQAGFVHFGLGTAERAEIRIKWPDGDWSNTYKAFADNFVRIDRSKPAAGYWLPPSPDEQLPPAESPPVQ